MNWGDFFSMDDRAFYIWASFGALAIAIIVEVVLLRMRARRVNNEIRQELMASNTGTKGGSK
jgi:heme exporter protein CcmD